MPRRTICCLLVWLAIASSVPFAIAQYTWVVDQLTDDGTSYFAPRISNGRVVFWGSPAGASSSNREIFLFDGESVAPLTSNSYLDMDPEISGQYVTWWGQPDGTAAANREIFVYDGETTSRVTNNSVRDESPRLSGSIAYWVSTQPNGLEIHRSSGAPLTSDSDFDGLVATSDSRVAWVSGSTPNSRVQLFNGESILTLGGNQFAIDSPAVSESAVAWEGFHQPNPEEAPVRDIFLYNGTNPNTPLNVSNTPANDFDPQASGDRVVWWGGVFNDFQIYQYDGEAKTTLSTGIRNQFPQIDGEFVVWQGYDGADDEILFWDGQQAIPVTNNAHDDKNPRISGNQITWEATIDGASQIMLGTRALMGDSNLDGSVDGIDYIQWAVNFKAENVGFRGGDFDQNGVVDGADYVAWATNFTGAGSLAARTAVVPEPSSAIPLACGLLLVFARRPRPRTTR